VTFASEELLNKVLAIKHKLDDTYIIVESFLAKELQKKIKVNDQFDANSTTQTHKGIKINEDAFNINNDHFVIQKNEKISPEISNKKTLLDSKPEGKFANLKIKLRGQNTEDLQESLVLGSVNKDQGQEQGLQLEDRQPEANISSIKPKPSLNFDTEVSSLKSAIISASVNISKNHVFGNIGINKIQQKITQQVVHGDQLSQNRYHYSPIEYPFINKEYFGRQKQNFLVSGTPSVKYFNSASLY
jgi:hypothetical protein